jgi:voltage-gated potassium channel Kch
MFLNRVIYNYSLLVLVIFTMFLVTLFPMSWQGQMYDYLFTLIYLNAALTMDKHRKQILIIAGVVMILEIGSSLLDMSLINLISKILNVIFFIYIVSNFISMIARSKKVNAKVILESINGYLLLGFVFSLLIAIAMQYDAGAFRFPEETVLFPVQVNNFSNYLYYSLVTLSTLGYGDIVPAMPFSKSLSVLTSITGQLYIAIIIAMLVGKYAAQQNDQ